MKVTRFDPIDSLIIVTAWIRGPRGAKPVSLAFDTAATQTHVIPDVLDDLGYGPRDGDRVTSVTSAIGEEPGYMMPVSKFSALGFTATNFRIHVHDLPETLGIQGLLGLSFLKQFNYEIRSIEGRILVARIATGRDRSLGRMRKRRYV